MSFLLCQFCFLLLAADEDASQVSSFYVITIYFPTVWLLLLFLGTRFMLTHCTPTPCWCVSHQTHPWSEEAGLYISAILHSMNWSRLLTISFGEWLVQKDYKTCSNATVIKTVQQQHLSRQMEQNRKSGKQTEIHVRVCYMGKMASKTSKVRINFKKLSWDNWVHTSYCTHTKQSHKCSRKENLNTDWYWIILRDHWYNNEIEIIS